MISAVGVSRSALQQPFVKTARFSGKYQPGDYQHYDYGTREASYKSKWRDYFGRSILATLIAAAGSGIFVAEGPVIRNDEMRSTRYLQQRFDGLARSIDNADTARDDYGASAGELAERYQASLNQELDGLLESILHNAQNGSIGDKGPEPALLKAQLEKFSDGDKSAVTMAMDFYMDNKDRTIESLSDIQQAYQTWADRNIEDRATHERFTGYTQKLLDRMEDTLIKGETVEWAPYVFLMLSALCTIMVIPGAGKMVFRRLDDVDDLATGAKNRLKTQLEKRRQKSALKKSEMSDKNASEQAQPDFNSAEAQQKLTTQIATLQEKLKAQQGVIQGIETACKKQSEKVENLKNPKPLHGQSSSTASFDSESLKKIREENHRKLIVKEEEFLKVLEEQRAQTHARFLEAAQEIENQSSEYQLRLRDLDIIEARKKTLMLAEQTTQTESLDAQTQLLLQEIRVQYHMIDEALAKNNPIALLNALQKVKAARRKSAEETADAS